MMHSSSNQSNVDLERHLKVAKYGQFTLTDAIRPGYAKHVIPVQGFRYDTYVDEVAKIAIPVIQAAVTRELLFDVFLDLIELFEQDVMVVLESSHETTEPDKHGDFVRHSIDMPVLKSMLWDYEQLLLHDGCTGFAVVDPARPQEVQLDEHKLLRIYGEPLSEAVKVLNRYGIREDENLKLIVDAEHVHISNVQFAKQFDQMALAFGVDE